MSKKVHWIGAREYSGPGLKRLVDSGQAAVVFWSRNADRARELVNGLRISQSVTVAEWDLGSFQSELQSGDCVVSHLPRGMQSELAELCLSKGAHLVSSRNCEAEWKKYGEAAAEKGLQFLYDCGIPGLVQCLYPSTRERAQREGLGLA